ncbi:MAG: hypothetical protein JO235_02215 [Chroococcidiopsidaceae cyanobacterium CP_BM_RX_35]|nr:hypothetical protein [Chroococcidiopsidaceae cyanobacterium CP_BM_RX_35]
MKPSFYRGFGWVASRGLKKKGRGQKGRIVVGDSDPNQIDATESKIPVGDRRRSASGSAQTLAPCAVALMPKASDIILLPSALCPLPSAFLLTQRKKQILH